MNEKVKPFLIDYYKSSPNVKLPAHRAGLSGNEISFLFVPLDPAYKAGLAGHLPVKNLPERDVGVALVGQEGN
jgi:hypothetical protein